jgi:hypothetical protein
MSDKTPLQRPLCAYGASLCIKTLTAERDALLAVLLDMLPLMVWSTAAEREPFVKAAREVIAIVRPQGPPDPPDWYEETK